MPFAIQHPPSLGAPGVDFRLPEPLTGRLLGPEDYPQARALLIAFLANGCPEVQRLAGALAELAWELEGRGLQVLAVNASDADALREDAPAAVAAEALRRRYVFPYLIDQTQRVARAYGVRRTPDFFLFGQARRLAYHGRFDETRFGGARSPHGGDLRTAIDHVLGGRPPLAHQVAAQGCAIRWRETEAR